MTRQPSPRELDILAACVTAGDPREAARLLGISEHHVYCHLRRMLDGCGCRTWGQAAWRHRGQLAERDRRIHHGRRPTFGQLRLIAA